MDRVSDALIRIKNGYMASLPEVVLPYSKMILSICQVLKKEGFLEDIKDDKGVLKATLKYESGEFTSQRKGVLTDVKRVSKPGLRVYKGAKNLPHVLDGLGIALISTPKGIMTDRQARKERLGGEVIAYVW